MIRNRNSRFKRRADIYDMNNPEHIDPRYDQYAKGSPSEWAEDRHPSDLWLGDSRNELNQPNMTPVQDKPWGRGQYDNKTPEPVAAPMGAPEAPVMARRRPLATRVNAVQIRRKATRCVRLAQAMLGKKASQSMLEAQAVEFMGLSDKSIFASLARLRKTGNDVDELAEKVKKVITEDDKKKTKEQEKASRHAAEETEEDEEGETEEHEESETEETEEALEAAPEVSEDVIPEAAPATGLPGQDAMPSNPVEDDMLNDLMGQDIDVELQTSPMMEEETLPAQSDVILRELFNPDTREVMAKKTVKKLGGAVKTAAKTTANDLSSLWKSEADVSDVFKY
jgi:hypothetical protein